MGFWIGRRRARISAAATSVLLAVLAGCGGAAPRLLDESDQAALRAQVESIRSALGDRARATAAVERFRDEVRRLRARGDLASADADVLLDHANQIERRVKAESPLPSPTPAPTPVVVVEPPPERGKEEEKPKDEEPGKGQGKGKKGGGND